MIHENYIFPTVIFSVNIFDYPQGKNVFDETLKQIREEKFSDISLLPQSEDSYLHKREEYYDITRLFNRILDDVKNKYNYDTERFDISQMWINKSGYGDVHPSHYHTNSYLSAVLYFTEGSNILFKDPVYLRLNSQLIVGNDLETHNAATNPEPGKLLIFPSWLYHGTEKNETHERISMSFNCLPAGKTNYNIPELRYSRLN